VESIAAYTGPADGIRVCPADRFREARLRAGSCGYVLNYYTSGGRPETFSGPNGDTVFGIDPDRNVNTYPRPSETFLLFEASNAGVNGNSPAFDDHTHPDTCLLSWGHVLADIDPYRHGRAANYLFADWHVSSVPAVTLQR